MEEQDPIALAARRIIKNAGTGQIVELLKQAQSRDIDCICKNQVLARACLANYLSLLLEVRHGQAEWVPPDVAEEMVKTGEFAAITIMDMSDTGPRTPDHIDIIIAATLLSLRHLAHIQQEESKAPLDMAHIHRN